VVRTSVEVRVLFFMGTVFNANVRKRWG